MPVAAPSTVVTGLCVGLVTSLLTYNVLTRRNTLATTHGRKDSVHEHKRKECKYSDDEDWQVLCGVRVQKRPRLYASIEALTYGMNAVALVSERAQTHDIPRRTTTIESNFLLSPTHLSTIHEVTDSDVTSDDEAQHRSSRSYFFENTELRQESSCPSNERKSSLSLDLSPSCELSSPLPPSPFKSAKKTRKKKLMYRVKGSDNSSKMYPASDHIRRRRRRNFRMTSLPRNDNEKNALFCHIFGNDAEKIDRSVLIEDHPVKQNDHIKHASRSPHIQRKVELVFATNSVKSA
uniref:AlNc14C622G12267 protein n=1 Tax=Albugo laibachii Nc14 TaxID=890382 RepID=F0X1H6_9STRA|nr:AlNc14C622G12267 [Albugo laibachii Nc14]|eukprot:CCA27662.1 AlNc14C622G12267 [Albugo laibachii Nc14]